jgi:hypothetical protein
VIGIPGGHFGNLNLRIEQSDQCVHDRGALTATLGAREETGFARRRRCDRVTGHSAALERLPRSQAKRAAARIFRTRVEAPRRPAPS